MDQGCVNFSSGFAKTNIYFEGWWWEGLAYPHLVWDGKKAAVRELWGDLIQSLRRGSAAPRLVGLAGRQAGEQENMRGLAKSTWPL